MLFTGEFLNMRQQLRHNTRTFRFICLVWGLILMLGSSDLYAQLFQSEPMISGYRDFEFTGGAVTSEPTEEKPESKLWHNDGYWWAVLWDSDNEVFSIYRFDVSVQSWFRTGPGLDDRGRSAQDVLWDDSAQKLYVSSRAKLTIQATQSHDARFYRLSYNSSTKTYSLDSSFPSVLGSTESRALVITKDSTGQLWATWTYNGKVMLNQSTGDGLTWGTPFVLPTQGSDLLTDATETLDIASICAFDGNKIGVLWGNQVDEKYYFSVHQDSNNDTTWDARETALELPLPHAADDHINLAVTNGTVLAALKTGVNGGENPLIELLKRTSNGTWTNHTVALRAYDHTRPVVLFDSDTDSVYVFAKSDLIEPFAIYYKVAHIDNLTFPEGLGRTFIESAVDVNLNNPSSTKQPVNSTTGLLVIASDKTTKKYVHNYLTLGGNVTPLAVDDNSVVPQNTPTAIDVLQNDSDANGQLDPTSVVVVTNPVNGSVQIDAVTGVITYTPNTDYLGSDSFQYTVLDDEGESAVAATVDITVQVNTPPVANNDVITLDEDTSAGVDVLANDSDSDGLLVAGSVTIVTPPQHGTTSINGTTGVVTYTPGLNFNGSDSFTYQVDDNSGGSSNVATVDITVSPVNDGPVASDDSAVTDEDIPVNIDVLTNDADVEPSGTLDPASVTVTSGPDNGSTSVVPETGIISYAPDPDFNGTDTFTYTVQDGQGGVSNPATVTVTVNDINDDPVAVDDQTSTNEEVAVGIDVTVNDTDVDGTLALNTVTIVAVPTNGTALVDGTTGVITYTPDENFVGDDSFQYTVNDDDNATSNAATVSISISDVNDPPATVDDVATTDEDTQKLINVLANDSDIDGSIVPATVAVVSAPANGNTQVNSQSGLITYTPAANYNGQDSFQYTVEDDDGATSPPATVEITVTDVNDAPQANNDARTINEDFTAEIDVLENDVDVDGTFDVTTVVITSGPVIGTASVNTSTGVVTYTPPTDFVGTDVFSYEVNDDDGATSNEAVVTVTVSAENDPPQANDDTATTTEETAVNIDVLANDIDVDGAINPATLVVTIPGNGIATAKPGGIVEYLPNTDFSGEDTFTYTVRDNQNDISNSATVTVTVLAQNDEPFAADDVADTHEGQSVVIDVISNDSDVDGTVDAGTVTIASQPGSGTVLVDGVTGAITYTPNAGFSGTDSFTYTVDDDSGLTSNPATVTINVNDLPVAVNDTALTSEQTLVVIDVLNNDSDSDGAINPTTVTITAFPGHGTTNVNPNDGKVSYTPVFNYFGTDTFKYTVTDNLGAVSNEATVTITINGGPTAVSDAPVTDEDVPIVINILANDLDPDGSLNPATVALVTNVINGSTEVDTTNGSVTYTPNAEFSGNDSFTYTVRDNLGEISNIATVSITINNVNDPPVAADDVASTGEDTAVDIDVTSNDSDIDGTVDASSVSIVLPPTNGATSVNASGIVTYTPNTDFFGVDTFTYTVKDDQGATSDTATVAVSVSGDNDSPTANNDVVATNENQAVAIDVLANDTDLDGTIDSTTVAIGTPPSHGVTSVNPATGAITYTPVFGFSGTDSFTYSVSDNDGLVSNIATVTISVNDLPVAIADNVQTNENQSVDVAVIANDTDSDGTIDTSTVSVVIPPTQGSAVANPVTGTVTYTPNPNFSGNDTFWYTVKDNLGASSNQALVSISINDLPVANNDQVTTDEETPIAIDILANDTDSNGSLVPATTVIVSQVTNGTISMDSSTAVMTYTPNAEFSGTDSFTYTVADNNGAVSNVASVTITVNPVNDPPVAVNDFVATGEDTPVNIDVKINDSDIDGTLDPTSVTISSNPSNGTVLVDPVTGVVTYTPNLNFSSTDAFTYTIKDNEGGLSNIAIVSVSVSDDNDPPTANDDAVVIDEDVVTVIDILANDTDVDGTVNPSSVTLVTNATHGTTSVDTSTGAVTYTPAANFFGSDTFTYTVNDNIGFPSNTATVNITINSVNDAPVAVDDIASTNPNTAVDISVAANDSDVDGTVNPSSILASAASNGTIAILPGGILRYTPFNDFIGTDSFTYTIKDNVGAISNVATVSVFINNLPIANDDAAATNEETPVAIDVLANDTDPDGSLVPGSVTVQTPPANGSTSVNPSTGNVTYTPNNDFSGIDTFTYTVQDDAGLTSPPATVTVTVNSVLDPPFAQNDNASTSENSPVTINVLANDTAIDGTIVPGTVTIATAPSNGIAIANPSTGQITYTPNNGFSGADVFTYTVADNNNNTSNAATVTVAVNALPSTLTFEPTDDSYVHEGNPTRHHGDATDLRVRQTGSTDIDTYLKFNLTGLGGPPQSATLRLYVINDSDEGGSVYPASNNLLNSSTPWTEDNITYPARPAINSPLGSIGATTLNQYVEFDVTDAISGDGIYSFGISRLVGGNNDLASYNSKETANPPQLVIETGGGITNPPPSITSFSPTSGPVGTVVTISGSNLLSVNSATFNGTPATNVVPLSGFQVLATVPSGAGTGKVSVSGPNGTALSSTDFTVEQLAQPPVITSFSPTNGPVSTPVIISGSNFTGATSVTFNGTTASYTVVSNNQIQSTVPNGATTGPVSVSNAHGTAVSAGFFTINNAPVITSFTPGSGPEGTSVGITGSNLTGVTDVSFNGTSATFTILSDTQITSSVPTGATSGPISATNSSGTAQSVDDFTVVSAPGISSFSPTTGPVGTAVTIFGTSFTGVTGVTFNGLAASGFSSISDSQLLATVPSGATTGPIGVTNPAGSATSSGNFTVTTGGGGGQTLTFQPTDDAYVHQGNPDRNHGDHSVLRVRLGSSDIDSYFKFNLSGLGGPPQSATLKIHVNDVNPSDGSSDGGTIYPASNNLQNSSTPWTEQTLIWDNRPDFEGQNPLSSAGAVGLGEEVEFDVTNAIFGDGTYSFVISNQNSDLCVYQSKETANPPELVIVTAGGGSQPPPGITSFSPASGPVGTVVTITGSNLLSVASAAFNGTPATNVTVLSGTQVRATVPSGAATGKISVSGSNGTAFSATDFTVEQLQQPPVISSFSPTNGPVNTLVTISGSNFTGATSVTFNGTAASYTVVSDNQIQSTVPNGATTGPVSVSNAHGTGVSAGFFTINNAPVITSFTPSSGLGGATVEIAGSNLLGATGVAFNGSAATFTVISDTRIDAIVPNNATSGKISVSNSSGTAQSVDDFTVVSSPSIASFTPTTGPVGTAVTILGTGFTGVTGVAFNGLAASGFSSISDSQLLATVPSGATTGLISVTNPAGTASSSTNFTVTTGGGGGQTLTFQPTDDSYVHEGNPDRNHGDHTVLRVRLSSSDIDSYFKFNLSGLGGPPQSATLKIHVNDVNSSDGSSDGGTIYPASNNLQNSSTPWTEETVIWDNRPDFDDQNPLSSVGAVDIGEEVEFDVTNAIFGDGTYSFVISNQSSDLGVYQSKETANPPELVIVTTGGGSQPPPSITSFSPASGPVGTVVTLTGSNLLSVASAAFNGTPATNVTVLSGTQVRATVPSGAATGKISVSGSNGTAFSATNFTVQQPQPPVITSFSPTSGAPGTTVTVVGTGFSGVTGVAFNSLAASSFNSISDSQLLATVPFGATTGPISVTNAAGIAASSSNFTVTSGGGGGQTLSFTATEDAYVITGNPEGNYNGNTLRIRKTSSGYNSYLKFNITGVSSPVQSAILRLWCTDGGSDGGSIHSVSNNRSDNGQPWTDDILTAANAPDISSPALSSVGTVTAGTFVDFDVSGAVNGNGTVSFAIQNQNSDAIWYSSTQGPENPELIITTGLTKAVAQAETDGHAEDGLVEVPEAEPALPEEIALHPNYPNPFNIETNIEYSLPSDATVKLGIFNLRGQLVRVLVNDQQKAGFHKIQWNGRNGDDLEVATGVYLVRLEIGAHKLSRKITLQK